MVGLGLLAVLFTLIEGLLRDLEDAREMAAKIAKDKKILDQIRDTIPFFSKLSDSECEELLKKMTTEEYDPGYQIVKEGDEANMLVMMLKGRVTITKEDFGWSKILESPSFFGESFLSTEKNTNQLEVATVSATEYVKALVLTRGDWIDLVDAKEITITLHEEEEEDNKEDNKEDSKEE
jgi:signal-transduction protein with cAMP-binding, CBS, and nucleotidyltransferase domain